MDKHKIQLFEDQKIRDLTFSIIKMVEDPGVPMRIVPVDVLYEELSGDARKVLVEEVSRVYTQVTGREIPSDIPCREYKL